MFHHPCYSFCLLRTLFFLFVGLAGQPKAVLARAYREACVCSSQVGARVQGVPSQHGPLHEPSGLRHRSSISTSTRSYSLSSWPILRNFKTENPTGLWARCSSGRVDRLCLPYVHLPILDLFKVQQCSVHNKWPFLHITDHTILPVSSPQRSSRRITIYVRTCGRSALLIPFSRREVRLRLDAYLLCEPCCALESWHVYLHPNVRVIVSPIAKITIIVLPRARRFEIAISPV